MKLFAPLRSSPTLRLLDRLAANYLTRRGNAVLSISQATIARTSAEKLCQYVERSGHLNTVSGRRPKAYKVLTRTLDSIRSVLRPGLTHYTSDGRVQTRVVT